MLWSAVIAQHPEYHLPGLFLYSADTDNGKSTFVESHKLWLARGVVDGALALNEKFNKKLAGAVIAYLDDQAMNPAAMGKGKSLITADTLDLRKMRTDSVDAKNFTHWIFTGNSLDVVPVEKNDTRFVIADVPTLLEEEKIRWADSPGEVGLRSRLQHEAPDFLNTLLTLKLPPGTGRLYLPVLMTEVKRKLVDAKEFDKKAFIDRINELIPKDSLVIQRQKLADQLGDGPWKKSGISHHLESVKQELNDLGIVIEFTQRSIRFSKVQNHQKENAA